jgi:hypothetical protein
MHSHRGFERQNDESKPMQFDQSQFDVGKLGLYSRMIWASKLSIQLPIRRFVAGPETVKHGNSIVL